MNTSIPPALFAPRAAAPGMAGDPLAVARTALLGPADLDEDSVARVLGDVMGHAVDYADAYFQLIREESWALEDGIVKDGAPSTPGPSRMPPTICTTTSGATRSSRHSRHAR